MPQRAHHRPRNLPDHGELVDSIVSITEQRTQETLESVLVETMVELLGPDEVALVDIAHPEPSVLIKSNDDGSGSTDAGALAGRESLALLLDALRDDTHSLHPAEPLASGSGLVYPIRHQRTIDTALCVTLAQPTDSDRRLADGLVRIYQNFLDLLNEKDHDRLTGLLNRKDRKSVV